MPKDSLKTLLKKFPYFLDKSSSSNFYKSQDVTNRRFQDVYNELFKVYESFHLNKRLLIWKDQNDKYDYVINFVATVPHLKRVRLYKNNTRIYSQSFAYEDNIDNFEYSYTYEAPDYKCNFHNDTFFNYANRLIIDGKTLTNKDEVQGYYLIDELGTATNLEECLQFNPPYTIIAHISNYTSGTYIQIYNTVENLRVPLSTLSPDKEDFVVIIKVTKGKVEYYVDGVLRDDLTWKGSLGTARIFLRVDPNSSVTYEDIFVCHTADVPGEYLDFDYSLRENIIPKDKFKIEVETHDEIIDIKGFPENDTIKGDIYDHDVSLDEIGALLNIPRKTYLTDIPVDLYEYTEPPFNDRGSEDDYHYMTRMLEYMVKLHHVHPVVLEIWKLYGIEADMLNRERFLIKMFDEDYHNGLDWAPQEWEHKDTLCEYTTDLGAYFFTSASTKTPLRDTPITLYFQLLDSLARTIDEDYLVDIYLNNTLIEGDYANKTYKLSNIPSDIENVCRIECKNSTGSIGSDEILISVRCCNNADLYVSETGHNHNPGTKESPLKTVQKAINLTNNDLSVIVVKSGNYDISLYDPIVVKNSCTILGCGSVLMENTDDYSFFKIPKTKGLSLNEVTLQYKGSIYDVDDVTVKNNNHDGSDVELIIYDNGSEPIELTRITMTVTENVIVGDTITVTGKLTNKYNNGVSGKTVRVTCPGSTPVNTTTESNGTFSAELEIVRTGILTVTSKFQGDTNYAPVRITQDITSKISITDALDGYDYVVMDMEYVDNDWNYTYKPVSEITSLSDMNGAIMNLQFTNEKDVEYTRYTSSSTSASITENEMKKLKGMLMGIIYDEYTIQHTDYEVN